MMGASFQSRFEANAARWQELLELAREAETMAGRWESGRLANPSQVAALYEQAYDARSVVLDARERAGQAACRLLSVTGVLLDDWPRLAN
jgi:hypothetical protein